MARGRGRGHKGQSRRFTSPEELKEQQKNNWRQKADGEASDEAEDSDEGSGSEDSSDESGKRKGPSGLIEIENPNRVQRKANKNLTIDGAGPSKDGTPAEPQELSRREREELEKQRAREAYARLHAQGKTDQARADLARLAIIKQQREDAQKRRDEERRVREADLKAKQTLTNKALGKK